MQAYTIDLSRTWEFFNWGLVAGFGLGLLMFILGLWSGVWLRWFVDAVGGSGRP
ncbi:MAG: hypothetical protein AAGG01_00865 [Planctomycetota bacterium]